MRSVALLCAAAVIGGGAASARAQTQVCSKSAPQMLWTVAILNPDGTYTTFPQQAIQNLINAAECACDSQDLYLQGRVYTAIRRPISPQAWVGTSCNVITSQPTNCEQIDATVSQSNFYPGASTGLPAQRIPVRALVSPRTQQNALSDTAHTCIESASIANSVYILFPFDPANPDYCAVQLTAKTSLPAPPTDLVAYAGDGALRLSWSTPPFGTADPPYFYQVLCADADGLPVPGQGAFAFNEPLDKPHQLAYTACVDPTNHIVERRYTTTAGTPIADGTPDGGTGFGVLSSPVEVVNAPDGGAEPPAVPSPAATAALGTFDKRFVVSDPITVLSASNTFRVDGLANGVQYTCVVLGIDNWGNPSPSSYVAGTPRPVQNLYRRFLAEGGQDQGFCFIATAAYGSPLDAHVRILRAFRDEVLARREWGRDLIRWYYRTSPRYAAWIRDRPLVRALVRGALWPIIGMAWIALSAGGR